MRLLSALVVAAAIASSPAYALQRPEISITAGRAAVVSGEPGDGGLAMSLSATWAIDAPLRAGFILHADDCGTDMGRLRDQRSNADLGAVAALHRFAYGAGWRVDAMLPAAGRWTPFASATLGVYRVQDDVRGAVVTATTATGFSLGGGVRRDIAGFGALGVSARWNRVQRGPSGGWLSAGLDWQARRGRRP
jgi:hypothetical protein